MTTLKFNDKREDVTPTFGDLNFGDWFTSFDGEMPFIKTTIIYDAGKNPYNTVSLDGEFYWSDVNEEVVPIREIEITIKR